MLCSGDTLIKQATVSLSLCICVQAFHSDKNNLVHVNQIMHYAISASVNKCTALPSSENTVLVRITCSVMGLDYVMHLVPKTLSKPIRSCQNVFLAKHRLSKLLNLPFWRNIQPFNDLYFMHSCCGCLISF